MNEGRFKPWTQAKQSFRNGTPDWKADPDYYNTGVMVVSKEHSSIFDPVFHEINHYYEQTHLNWKIFQSGFPVFDLHYKFNRLMYISEMTGENPLDSYFLHYAGGFSWAKENEQLIEDNFDALINHDTIWKTGKRDFPRNIYCQTGGGLGDVIASEPTVRYLLDKVYPGSNFVIKTHWPEVFEHLKDRSTVITFDSKMGGKGSFYEIYLMPDKPALPLHGLTHPTDFSSIKAFGGQLPPEDKRIKLALPSGVTKFKGNKRVLVHAGKGWPAKTFPKEYWQTIVDGLTDHGYIVTLIGKNIEGTNQGYVDVNGSRCIDLRDKLSLLELFEVIANTPLLITNDSAPLHIAGAFDNHICLINVCKPAYLLLPFRHSSQHWKTKVFENLLPISYDAARVYPLRFDEFTEAQVKEKLPPTEDILNWVRGLS